MPDRDRPEYLLAPRPLRGPVVLHEYSAAWPIRYAREESRIRSALGERAVLVAHVGSTSVPGLAAKPIIDICLAVADSADEPAYLPDLVAAGYTLYLRDPNWYQHRLLKSAEADVNLHVFSTGCAEIDRCLRLRDRLRADATDRLRYEQAKRRLADRHWEFVQDYADAKSEIIEAILGGWPLKPPNRESAFSHDLIGPLVRPQPPPGRVP